MTVLRSRLLDRKIAEENAKYAAHRKDQVGTGERSEKIRTYNFPQNRVTDHRIEVTLYDLANFIDGDLDPLIEPLMTHDLEEKLAALKLESESFGARTNPRACEKFSAMIRRLINSFSAFIVPGRIQKADALTRFLSEHPQGS